MSPISRFKSPISRPKSDYLSRHLIKKKPIGGGQMTAGIDRDTPWRGQDRRGHGPGWPRHLFQRQGRHGPWQHHRLRAAPTGAQPWAGVPGTEALAGPIFFLPPDGGEEARGQASAQSGAVHGGPHFIDMVRQDDRGNAAFPHSTNWAWPGMNSRTRDSRDFPSTAARRSGIAPTWPPRRAW